MTRLAWVPKGPQDLPPQEALLDEVLGQVREELLALTQAKGILYQDDAGVDSCFKRGLPGLYHNLARKWDRIDAVGRRLGFTGEAPALTEEAALDGGDPETLYKTVRDLAVYCIHTMRWLQGEHAHAQDPI